MPAVTVPPRPNGLPTARTQSPMRGDLSENFTYGNGPFFDLNQREIGARICSNDLGIVNFAIVGRDLNAFRRRDCWSPHSHSVMKKPEPWPVTTLRPRPRGIPSGLSWVRNGGRTRAIPGGTCRCRGQHPVRAPPSTFTRTDITARVLLRTISAKPTGA